MLKLLSQVRDGVETEDARDQLRWKISGVLGASEVVTTLHIMATGSAPFGSTVPAGIQEWFAEVYFTMNPMR